MCGVDTSRAFIFNPFLAKNKWCDKIQNLICYVLFKIKLNYEIIVIVTEMNLVDSRCWHKGEQLQENFAYKKPFARGNSAY